MKMVPVLLAAAVAAVAAVADNKPHVFLVGDSVALQVFQEITDIRAEKTHKEPPPAFFDEFAGSIASANGFPLQYFKGPTTRFLRVNGAVSLREAAAIARLADASDLVAISMSLHTGARRARMRILRALRAAGVRATLVEPSWRHVRGEAGACKPATRSVLDWLFRKKPRGVAWTEETRGLHADHAPANFSKLEAGRCVHWKRGGPALRGVAERILAS